MFCLLTLFHLVIPLVSHLHFSFFFLMIRRPPRSTPFPTRRSSDLTTWSPFCRVTWLRNSTTASSSPRPRALLMLAPRSVSGDRKSTRLNSSHLVISYAVFCLKKKKKKKQEFCYSMRHNVLCHVYIA